MENQEALKVVIRLRPANELEKENAKVWNGCIDYCFGSSACRLRLWIEINMKLRFEVAIKMSI